MQISCSNESHVFNFQMLPSCSPWMLVILGSQSCLFHFPRLAWQTICHSRTGADLEHIIMKSVSVLNITDKAHQDTILEAKSTIEHIISQVQNQRNMWFAF